MNYYKITCPTKGYYYIFKTTNKHDWCQIVHCSDRSTAGYYEGNIFTRGSAKKMFLHSEWKHLDPMVEIIKLTKGDLFLELL